MTRVRPLGMWNLGILIITYYCMAAYSQTTDIPDVEESDIPVTYISSDYGSVPEFELSEPITLPFLNKHGIPKLRPMTANCTPPVIEQFPKPLMRRKARNHGGLIIHLIVAIFSFLGLAIVCDDYFVASLDRLCEELKLSPDVAGATFMAAGSSAPELATFVIGIFFAKDDIGINSGVIGSAVFNMMFVISVCALCCGTVCQLNWWPLVRDCFFYCLSILLMLVVIFNDYISWFESVIMLLLYVIYCITLHFNTSLEKWALSLNLPKQLPTKEQQIVPDTSYIQDNQQQVISLSQASTQPSHSSTEYQNYNDPNSNWDRNATWCGESSAQSAGNTGASGWKDITGGTGAVACKEQDNRDVNQWNRGDGQQNYAFNPDQPDQVVTQQESIKGTSNGNEPPKVGQPGLPEYYKSKHPKAREPQANPLEKPTTGGLPKLIYWHVVFPIHCACRYTMPDCRTEEFRNWYPFTFIMSMVWISFFSYILVWMITIIGTTIGISDSVMSLTFIAAGFSVPDALNSIAVIKKGYGNMAVSNVVGSNVFVILVCLGLPWLIQTAIILPGTHVNAISRGMLYSTLTLLSTVLFLFLSIHLNGWKLDKRLSIILMVWYFLFIIFASLYELNVFGNWNLPECLSMY